MMDEDELLSGPFTVDELQSGESGLVRYGPSPDSIRSLHDEPYSSPYL
uniref:Bravo_FIGEY domain-containing protein n=1 Tax=Heterorhabditis bacteriophora TaxID=37862 RepID=A0A1I7X2W0_HETBA